MTVEKRYEPDRECIVFKGLADPYTRIEKNTMQHCKAETITVYVIGKYCHAMKVICFEFNYTLLLSFIITVFVLK